MAESLPDRLLVWEGLCALAASGKTFSGHCGLGRFDRLAAALVLSEGGDRGRDESEARYRLDLSFDERGFVALRGSLETSLPLVCQRCLGSVDWALDVSFKVAVVVGEALVDRVPEDFEPVVLSEDGVPVGADGRRLRQASDDRIGADPFDGVDVERALDLWQVLEDGLLLALPAVAMHPLDQCSADRSQSSRSVPEPLPGSSSGDVEAQAVDGRQSPFDVLKNLKK